MRAEAVVRGLVDHQDMWPYATGSEGHGDTSVLALRVRDSQELLGVIRTLMARGVVVTNVRVLTPTSPDD